jgi:predicted nucleic acid-binding protein
MLQVECANILWKKVRLGELSKDRALKDFVVLLRAPIALTRTGELLDDALRLAIELSHPVYNCLYLALALRHGFPLVTADRRLVAAARKDPKLAGRVILLGELPLD